MAPRDEYEVPVSGNDFLLLHPAIKRALIGSIVFIGLFVLGLYWVFDGLDRTLGAISPNATEVSSSLEPYEIALRSRLVDSKKLPEDAEPVEWIIKIPRAFIIKEFGTNGVTYDQKLSEPSYIVYIDGVINSNKTSIKPAVLVPNGLKSQNFIGIVIQNSGSRPELRSGDLCINQDDLHTLTSTGGANKRPSKFCGEGTVRCQIETQYRGWRMGILVAKDSEWYRNPETACTFAKDFLLRSTTKIDSLYTK